MTLHATREGKNITVHGNTGVTVLVENSHVQHARITENHQHVKYFHAQLGKLLDEAEAEEQQDQESRAGARRPASGSCPSPR